MAKKIEGKITAFRVADPDNMPEQEPVEVMHEGVSRPEVLHGSTYKIQQTGGEPAVYVTVNDIVLNAGSSHEERRPYEVFINSKNLDHAMWISALTRLISAVFRKGGDVTFIVGELRGIFDPRGGYFVPGEGFKNSLVAHIGDILEQHFIETGLIRSEQAPGNKAATDDELRQANWCSICNNRSVVMRDGCMTCLSCGDSKCQ